MSPGQLTALGLLIACVAIVWVVPKDSQSLSKIQMITNAARCGNPQGCGPGTVNVAASVQTAPSVLQSPTGYQTPPMLSGVTAL